MGGTVAGASNEREAVTMGRLWEYQKQDLEKGHRQLV